MAVDDDDVLNIGVDLDTKSAIKQMDALQKGMTRSLGLVMKAVDKLGKANARVTDMASGGTEDWSDAASGLTAQIKKLEGELPKLQGAQRKMAEAGIKSFKRQQKEVAKSMGGGGKGRKGGGVIDTKSMAAGIKEALKEGSEEFKDAISSLFSKDVGGTIKNLGKMMKRGLSGVEIGGAKLGKLGGGMQARGAELGGMKGAGLKAAGGGLAAMGKMAEVVGKLGPLIGVITTGVASLVKLFVDAEAEVKEFQKGILESSSTIEFMSSSFGQVDLAASNLKDTVRGIRDAAFSFDKNIKSGWWLKPEKYQAVINVLNQEGVSLSRMAEEAKKGSKSMEEFAAELTHTGVAYSRAFGVPLQEINQLQAEMMTSLGQSLDETRLSFAQMTRSATDSGIAANKFFAIIRSVSQDLSLYNTRMEDAVKMLGMLGKVMDPRNAAKFMQSAMQGLKNMGRMERLRLTLLTGQGKMANLVKRDTQQKAADLGKKLKMSGEEVMAVIQKKGMKGLEGQISQLPKETQGAVREMGTEIQLQLKRSGKGLMGVSGAAANLGPAAALQAMQGALQNFGGGKKLSDIVGTIGGEMMAENLGVSQEQLDQMVKFEMALDMERETLKEELGKLQKIPAKNLTKEQKARKKELEGLGDIDKAGYDQIFGAMSEGDRKLLEEDSKVRDFAKEQTDLQTSMLDKLDILIKWFMNTFYNLVVDIWEAVASLGGGSGKLARVKAAQTVGGAGKAELQELASKDDFKAALDDSKLIKAMNQTFDLAEGGAEKMETLERIIGTTKEAKDRGESALKPGSAWSKKDEKQLKALEEEKAMLEKNMNATADIAKSMSEGFSKDDWRDALEKAGLSSEQLDQFYELAKNIESETGHEGVTGALAEMGLAGSDTELKAMRNLPETADGGRSITVLGDVADHLKEAGTYNETTAEATKDLEEHGVKKKNSIYVRFGNSFLKGPYKDVIASAVLESVRKALFEYYMYKDTDPADTVKAMVEQGLSIGDIGRIAGEQAEKGKTWGDFLGGEETPEEGPKGAHGAYIVSTSNGIAQTRDLGNGGLMEVHPGEYVGSPSRLRQTLGGGGGGGGGGHVVVELRGDAKQLFQVQMAKTIQEHERAKRR